jgi:uncharacterized membrane protein YesL
MNNRKEFGDGLVFTLNNYLWWFLMANIYFILVNIPFIFIWLLSAKTGAAEINIYIIICALPIGPALIALYSVMGKLIREKDLDITKDFFKAYKNNLKEGMFFWTIFVVILSCLYIDITIVKVGTMFNLISMVLGFIVISIIFYVFPLISRFYLKKIDILKLAFIYSIKKIHITILNWLLLFVVYLLLSKIPTIMFLFLWSIFGYFVMLMQKGILKEIEEKIK